MSNSSDEIIDAWPTCPQCAKPRHAQCQTCGETRDFYPAAYQQAGEEHRLRFCEICDDVTRLRLFRRCPGCGHDFGEGYEPPALPPAENDGRAWIVLWILVAGAAALGGYFYLLFR